MKEIFIIFVITIFIILMQNKLVNIKKTFKKRKIEKKTLSNNIISIKTNKGLIKIRLFNTNNKQINDFIHTKIKNIFTNKKIIKKNSLLILNTEINNTKLNLTKTNSTANVLPALLLGREDDKIKLYLNLDKKKKIINDDEIIVGEVIKGFYNLFNLENGDLIYNII